MSYIHAMQTLELEVAGEYLVMAATLMAIKSQMLLPKQELEIIDDENFLKRKTHGSFSSSVIGVSEI